MKNTIIALFILFLSLASQAQTLPSCNDPKVVLSPYPLLCVNDNVKLDFDIPELKINERDLDKIFKESEGKLGSESSGGRTTNPSAQQAQTYNTDRSNQLSFRCELRIISDGQKALSYLSIQTFTLSNQGINISPYNFNHYIIKRNSFFPEQTFAVTQPPQVDLSNYLVDLKKNYSKNRLTIKLCERSSEKNLTCAKRTRDEKRFKRALLKIESIEEVSNTFKITKNLRLSCLRN